MKTGVLVLFVLSVSTLARAADSPLALKVQDSARDLVSDLREPYGNDMGLTKPDEIRQALVHAQQCSDAVDEALAKGVKPDTKVDFNMMGMKFAKPPMPISDVKVKVCQYGIDKLNEKLKTAAAAEDGLYGPFLDVLTGDKKTLFKDKKMLAGTDYYGSKGKRLTKPADFKAASAWYYYVHDRNGAVPRWEVEGWVFKGDKKTGVYDKQGVGQDPPNSAFK